MTENKTQKLHYNHIDKLRQEVKELLLLRKSDGISNDKFKDAERIYKCRKEELLQDPDIEGFILIAIEYYTQKIKQAKEKEESSLAYELELAKYDNMIDSVFYVLNGDMVTAINLDTASSMCYVYNGVEITWIHGENRKYLMDRYTADRLMEKFAKFKE